MAADVQARNRMIEQSGQLGVPVIIINDQVVIGFDKSKLEQLLGLKE